MKKISGLLVLWMTTVLAHGWAAEDVFPGETWSEATPESVHLVGSELIRARDYALTGGGSGIITRHGRAVLRWGDQAATYDLKSSSKSIGITALGLALLDGRMKLEDPAARHHPSFGVPPDSNRATGWLEKVTLLHLATQTAGFEKPGGYTPMTFEPGTQWRYSDGGPNWLAECITHVYQQDLQNLLFERVFGPIGIRPEDLRWRRHAYRDRNFEGVARREFGSGVHANVDAMARIGTLYLRGGEWQGQRILPADFVEAAGRPVTGVVGLPEAEGETHGDASDHYGLLWWNNADGALAGAPRDAYWSWGLYDSLIVIIPSLDIVVARAGKSWRRNWSGHYDVLKPVLEPIVAAAGWHPPSPVIAGLEWAPADTITRRARGGDNWPMTWGIDDTQFTAYGDGRGFEPFVERKLSMGLALLSGGPTDFVGSNLRSPTAEKVGQGRNGPKVSGLLMADGVLYLWARNTGNAQLAWSADQGRTWTWSDWRFSEGFGYPTFLNFGRNYEGARDAFVYVYSHDHDSAYERADTMVLARVPRDRIRDRDAYEFLARRTGSGRPEWSPDIAKRGPVFRNPGRCYRSSVSYNPALKRYLWCQTGLGTDTRFEGGFAIYDAPEPWGPWTEVYRTDNWDTGPGETQCLPVKWMSPDGLTMRLVFSGDDAFSVRRCTVRLKADN